MLPQKLSRVYFLPVVAIVLGLVVRLLLMPVAAYGDMHTIAYALHLLGFHGVTNVYAALHTLPHEPSLGAPFDVDIFPYPPLTYFVLGGAMALLRPLYGDGFSPAVSSQIGEFLAARPQVFLWLTLYKLPLLAADLGIAATLAAFGTTVAQRWRLAALWMVNPIPIVAVYLFGQFDVLPALCVLLAYLAVVRDRPWLAAALLGVGAGFKTFPLLLLLPFAIIVGRSWLQRAGLTAVGLLTFALAFLPVANDPVTFEVIFGADPARRVFQSEIIIGQVFNNPGSIYLVFLLCALVTLHAMHAAAGRPPAVWRWMLAILLLAHAFSYSHLQWFTWAVPFMVLDWERHPENRVLHTVMVGCVLVIGVSWQVGPLLEFFRPLSPALALGSPAFGELVEPYMAPTDIANILRSLLAAAALYWTWNNVFHAPREPLALQPPVRDGVTRTSPALVRRASAVDGRTDQAAG